MEFPLVVLDDVLDPERLCFLVEHGSEPEWAMIRAECSRPLEVQEAVAAINRLLKATQRDLGAAPIEDMRESQRLARHRRSGFGLLRLDRPRLDELCGPAVLREGKGIELADGMISAREFIEAIPLGVQRPHRSPNVQFDLSRSRDPASTPSVRVRGRQAKDLPRCCRDSLQDGATVHDAAGATWLSCVLRGSDAVIRGGGAMSGFQEWLKEVGPQLSGKAIGWRGPSTGPRGP